MFFKYSKTEGKNWKMIDFLYLLGFYNKLSRKYSTFKKLITFKSYQKLAAKNFKLFYQLQFSL